MDIFAHSLWTGAIFYKKYNNDKKNLFLSVLFGILPDLLSFAPVFIYAFFARKGFFELIGSGAWVVNYASQSYNFTHSFVIFLLGLAVVLIIRKGKIYWPMFGWLLHILIDIPTHRGFYETPFLFPLSGYQFSHGISWGHPVFMIINYSAIAIVYISIFLYMRRNKGQNVVK
jgi:hypothetical protein